MTERIYVRDVLHAASRVTGVSADEIVGKGKASRPCTVTRAAIVLFAKEHTGRSVNYISSIIGKDHSTSLYYLKVWGHQRVVLDVVDGIRKALAGDWPALPPQPRAATSKVVVPPARKFRAIVAPFPPGVDAQILAGVPLKKLRALHPEWRGFDA